MFYSESPFRIGGQVFLYSIQKFFLRCKLGKLYTQTFIPLAAEGGMCFIHFFIQKYFLCR